MKQIKRFCMLVAAIILCGTANVWADEVNYMFRQWNGNNAVDSEERTVTNPEAITSSTTAIGSAAGTWYVVNGKVTIASRVTVSGHAYIILADGCELTCPKGITVMDGNELIVYGQTGNTGLLKITSPDAGNAGLGGACGVKPDSDKTPSSKWNCGTVTIHGGHLVVHGAAWSAGIGGGWMQRSCKVTILGGNVEAYAGEDAAGIGSGCFDQRENWDFLGLDTGWTKIYGGKVKAEGGDSGAGIGGGACRYVGKIEIFGGEVTANGGVLGAGIGGGSEMDGSAQSGGVEVENSGIYIYGGEVWANGGLYAAGIGGGFGSGEFDDGAGNGGHIEIHGGTVWANGGSSAAGIGGSCYAGLRGLTITGGDIHAIGGEYAAGIGAGEIADGANVSVIIRGGTVDARGGEEGAGIGTGACSKLISSNGNKVDVIISGGIVEATGGKKGAGIGGGNEYVKSGIFHITGGTLVAKAGEGCNGEKPGEGSAIGCGYGVSNKGSDSKSGTFIIPSSMMMIAGSSETDNRVFGYDERRDGCVWRSYIELKPCLEHDYSYVIVYGGKHAYRCRRCAFSSEDYHDYTNNGICVCGKRYDPNEPQCKVRIYKKVDAFSTDYNLNSYNAESNINGYIEYDTEMDAEFTLPTCDIIASDYSGSYKFVGWMVAPTETPASCMFYDTDKLYEEGRTIIIPHTSGVNVYARYMYEFSPKMVFDGDDNLISDGWNWTWDEEKKTYSAATVTIENKALKYEGYTDDVYKRTINAKIVKSDLQKGDDDKYYYHYYALASYDDVDFTDVKEQELTNFVILENDNDNNQIIGDNIEGNTDNVYLEDRVLYKDNSWNTLCLPFSLSSFTGTPLEGATVKTLTSATIDNGTLTLNFSEDLTSIVAGQPYIVKWENVPTTLETYDGTNEDTTTDLYSPTFWEVGITTATAGTVEGTAADFVGQFASKEFTEADNTVLFLGGGNTLYYPDAPMTIGAQRAYFQLKNGITAGDSASAVRSIVLNFGDEETGISATLNDKGKMINDKWYSLDGRRLSGKPTVKGLYIHNGRKVVIKK